MSKEGGVVSGARWDTTKAQRQKQNAGLTLQIHQNGIKPLPRQRILPQLRQRLQPMLRHLDMVKQSLELSVEDFPVDGVVLDDEDREDGVGCDRDAMGRRSGRRGRKDRGVERVGDVGRREETGLDEEPEGGAFV